ncbi:NAD(P)-binding protein [Trichoderma sp. SZMC 28015]
MVFQYKRVLLVGATAGIGAAMADKLIEEGSKVIAVGRRQERLDAFVAKHGAERASAIKFDVTDRAGLDAFVNKVVQTYPDLDCVFLNSGTQTQTKLTRPEEIDLEAFHHEFNVNYTSVVNLTIKFLPHLLKKDYPTSIIVTGSILGLIPAFVMPAYSASKAALRAFFDCLRRQNQGFSKVKFIEILPPAVQTELHDYMGIERGRALGMPLDQFTEQAYAQLATDKEIIIIGNLHGSTVEETHEFLEKRDGMFNAISNAMAVHFQP